MIPSAPSRDRQRRPPTTNRSWQRRYARGLLITDAAIVLAVCLGYGIPMAVFGRIIHVGVGDWSLGYVVFMLLVALLWLLCLEGLDTRDARYVGHGVMEYRQVVTASVTTFTAIVTVAFFLRAELSHTMFVTVLPVGTLLLVISRWVWRQWLRGRQQRHRYVDRAIVLGEPVKVAHVATTIRRVHGTGFDLLGAITGNREVGEMLGGIPVLGTYADAVDAIDRYQAHTVILAGSDDLNPRATRELGWALSDRDLKLVVAPALTDVAGPRVHARPMAGLPLIHVAFPTLEGARRVAKRTFDIIGSALLIVVFSVPMLAAAIAVKVSSPGPVIYRQERIGRRGKPFGMYKFRSMVEGADDQLASLLDAQGTNGQPLFKVIDDPRITRVGRFMRRHSIDELPQLFNVLRGQMSLVGPRPQRAAEVELYDDHAHRRLLVKPGMSGLWQVNGRSRLSWEDTLRFDLYYIENWSLTQDIIILFRTFKAVLKPDGGAH